MIGLFAPESCLYEAQNLIKAFFPSCEPLIGEQGETNVRVEYKDGCVSVEISDAENSFVERESTAFSSFLAAPDLDLALGRAFYRAASAYTDRRPPWGILTGVRPAKLFLGLVAEKGEQGALKAFGEEFYVSPEKTEICRLIAENRAACGTYTSDNECSLYISIPFCPSRCSYCSFVSQDNDRAGERLKSDYFRLLCEEIKRQTEYIDRRGKILKTVYIGGGTPATLTPQQLSTLGSLLYRDSLTEFTVELGRPDAITAEKLAAVKGIPNIRISINPQTLSDEVLVNIGRKHTVKQFYESYDMAVKMGLKDINTDIIIGLPGDTAESFENTLNEIIRLDPSSVTIHSYAKKRSSRLAVQGGADAILTANLTVGMHSECSNKLLAAGYTPYYLYRQRDIVGGNENIGWCRDNYWGRYNIYMMDELHSVYACGAGGVSKTVTDSGRKITRFFNYKLPLEYVRNFELMMSGKQSYLEE